MTSLKIGFSFNNFESHWDTLDEASKSEIVDQAGLLSPTLGILPILEGITSFHFDVRSKARKNLEIILYTIQQQINNPEDTKAYLTGIKTSAMVSARIYQKIRPEIPFNEMVFFLQALLKLGDQGAYFAFKAFYKDQVTLDSLKKVIQSMGQSERLAFVDQYLQATPADRLKFGKLFKNILNTVTHREPIIAFYASLFDRQRDADPFLNNINFKLRDPETVIKNEIGSDSPAVKIAGLKALSLIQVKIPVQLLFEAIEDDVKKIRMAVYSIIENSSMGLYPELFDPVLKRFYHCHRHEAIAAFKALVVTGKVPVHRLFQIIRDTYPEIMPFIHMEITSLSRISFFVIQDIALNKEKYQTDNFDINLACILGMIKKRPERVVKIINGLEKGQEKISGKKLKNDVVKFVGKTKKLLLKEKEHIQAPFDDLFAKFKDRALKAKKPTRLFAAVLQNPVKKKIEAFKQNRPVKSIYFTDHIFENEILSGLEFSASDLFFDGAVFENCDLSNSQFRKAIFKNTLFHTVNMDGSLFDNINFDNAVFINVSARKTVFKNCSFQGACLYNCNFNQAELTDAVFINATLAKISFGNTQLSWASFAHSRISAVSFATAHINQADFSWVRARFSRFPSYARAVIRTEEIDYNDRHYQLGFNDLPRIDKNIVSEINMLIFCEFIHYGETKFLDQNKLSLLTAFDIFKSSQADFFQIIPLLIHENLEFCQTGPIHSQTPCGIAEYLPSSQAVQICEKYTGKNKFKVRRNLTPFIEGLFTMGSIGSLAQTFESDIDYWVCINENLMDNDCLDRLRKKLVLLETMAWNKFKTRVTFFVVDILKAKNNDFGGSTQESSGSAQSRLLKEEFYRTMIHVAGKLPLWSVLPTTISLNYYNIILKRLGRFSGSHRYMDLGDIHAIPVNEYFGASIWQMFKWLQSPFKSVIKMALLEKYIHAYGKESLLCNQYKNEWMNSGSHLKLAQNDSYVILLKHLIDYYHENNDSSSVNLLLTCFFLKLEILQQEEINNTVFGLRKILLEKCLEEWGWDLSRVFEIGRYKEWSYTSIQRLSFTLEQYMQTKFTQVKQLFENQTRGRLMISDEDRKVLERKVAIVFLEKPHKIKKILLVSRGDRHFERLHLKHIPTPEASGRWELFQKNLKIHQDDSFIKADSIEEIGAWLINNSLYTSHSMINLVPNPTVVTHEDVEKLFKNMYEYFNPIVTKQVHFRELSKEKPKIVSLFISINFYVARQQSNISDYCAVYINSWGEMYFRSSRGKAFSSMDTAKVDILETLGIRQFPLNTVFYFSKGMAR